MCCVLLKGYAPRLALRGQPFRAGGMMRAPQKKWSEESDGQ